jgi:hypothetical protein
VCPQREPRGYVPDPRRLRQRVLRRWRLLPFELHRALSSVLGGQKGDRQQRYMWSHRGGDRSGQRVRLRAPGKLRTEWPV